MTCQTRSSRNSNPPVQETEIPSYPFVTIAHDLSGPYPITLSGNKYIVPLIDIYSSWPEVLKVHSILDDIFPRHRCPLQLLTANITEMLLKTGRNPPRIKH